MASWGGGFSESHSTTVVWLHNAFPLPMREREYFRDQQHERSRLNRASSQQRSIYPHISLRLQMY